MAYQGFCVRGGVEIRRGVQGPLNVPSGSWTETFRGFDIIEVLPGATLKHFFKRCDKFHLKYDSSQPQ